MFRSANQTSGITQRGPSGPKPEEKNHVASHIHSAECARTPHTCATGCGIDPGEEMTSDWIRPAQSRRGFLRIGAGAVAAGALQPIARAQDATFRRWEITDPGMPPGVLDSYKKGIREMLKLPATDSRNWYRQAFVHIFDCPHGNWWFLAWHRAYLGWMEQTLRDLSGDAQFALPYWDWTKAPRIPAAMFDDVLDPNNATFIASFNDFRSQFNTPVTALWGKWSREQKAALARRGLNTPADFWNEAQQMFFDRPGARGLTAASPDLDSVTQVAVRIATVRAALQTTIFAGTGTGGAGFASAKAANHSVGSNKGILESQPHDNVHGAIGGPSGNAFMVSFLSQWTRSSSSIMAISTGCGRVEPPANGAETSGAAAGGGPHGVVGREIPILQRCSRPAGLEDQRRRLRDDRRIRVRLLTRIPARTRCRHPRPSSLPCRPRGCSARRSPHAPLAAARRRAVLRRCRRRRCRPAPPRHLRRLPK